MADKRDFTDRYLRSLKPAEKGKRYIKYDAQVPQFGIRVSDKSTRDNIGAFVLVARFPGSPNPAPRSIADFPATPLGKAREVAREWRELIAKGIDPKSKQDEERRAEERRRADTFDAVLEVYAAERLAKKSERYARDAKSALKRYAGKAWGDRPIASIRRADVKSLIREIDKDAPAASSMQLTLLKTFFKWCEREELLESSPASSVESLADEVRRDRVLAEWEIRALWRACARLGAFGRAFQFMLVTGQRRTEVGQMKWSELDLRAKVWTLPRERTKADRAHEVPLSDVGLSIINDCPRISDYVFATGRAARDGGEAALAGWSKAKGALDALMLVEAQQLANERGEEPLAAIAGWRLHDLRRTCATNLARLGVDRIVISKLLNHAEGGVTSVYDRHARDPEKRAAMERWGQRLREIVDGTDGSNVVPLRAER